MAQIDISHFTLLDPRLARLRKRRARRIRPVRPSKRVELWYREQLLRIVGELRQAGEKIAAGIKPSWPHVGDAVSPDVRAEIAAAAEGFGDIELTARRLTQIADRLSFVRRSQAAVDERLSKVVLDSVGVNIKPFLDFDGEIRTAMRAAAEANVALIKTIPEEYFASIRESVESAFASGQRWEEIAARIAEIGKITERRARFIARDQVAKLNSDFSRVRQVQVGIKRYRWRGALDKRERQSHRDLEGEVCRWDSPPIVDGEAVHPGQAVGCRCVPEPEFDLDQVDEDGGLEAEAA